MKQTPELTQEELTWVDWQLALPGFGLESQNKLKQATALVSRVGGVGSPAAVYLAMAGIGRLILAHGGHVEPFHLNRWPLAEADQVDRVNPAVSAAEHIRKLNPRVELEVVSENITPQNVEQLVGQADIVVDGAPYFEERHLMNAACVRQRKPMVEAAATGMEGFVTTVIPGETPCLQCLGFHSKDWSLPFPILGPIAGTIGSLAALEAIKVLTGYGEPLRDTLLFFDGLSTSFRRLKVHKNPACPVCGGDRNFTNQGANT
jgi:molybdopterin/thiamine biosynthesis adenylyltransferase